MGHARELHPEELAYVCDPATLGAGTAEVEPLEEPVGQARALAALEFGTGIAGTGYNLFVMGPPGTGRSSMTRLLVGQAAARREAPPEWCYVHNFDDARRPRALCLPAGRGSALRREMDELIRNLDQAITAVFESDEYSERRDEVLKEFREERQSEFSAFEQEAGEAGFTVGRGPAGLFVAPVREGEMLPPQEYAQLPEAEREVLEAKRTELQERLQELLRRGQRKEKEARDEVRKLDREMVQFATAHLFEEAVGRYEDLPEVGEHLRAIMADLVENVAKLRDGEEHQPFPLPPGMSDGHGHYDRYRVNLLTERDSQTGAPVVYEPNPTLHNLTGEVEYQTVMGALVTDFTMIRAGALHRANGGYLILDALAVLRRPYAWDALTRALKNREVRIESLGDQFRLVSTVTLEPEPVPLEVKVVLIGAPLIYHLLYAHDEDFQKQFKVKADFGPEMERSAAHEQQYLRFLARESREKGLPPFSAAAVARIIEHGVRLAGDREKLTMRFMDVADVAEEAAFWARKRAPEGPVEAEDVQRALEQSVWRSNRVEERLLELIEQGTLRLETRGTAVGQVNGIALLPLGDYLVGKPTRITARSFLGRAGVVNLEREVKLSGPIHDKGVLILSGYLGEKYASDRPLSCAATLGFEQSYEEVEGDSASAAELFALLSSLGRVPLRQEVGVTGSVDQHGHIQPVGGVTRKVEGFYEACCAQGLTGTQGVLLPAANVRNLQLRREVVEAVEQGQFHVWAMETIDEGLEHLSGLPAGEPDASGEYPEGTAHGAVRKRLGEFAEVLRSYASGGEEDKREVRE